MVFAQPMMVLVTCCILTVLTEILGTSNSVALSNRLLGLSNFNMKYLVYHGSVICLTKMAKAHMWTFTPVHNLKAGFRGSEPFFLEPLYLLQGTSIYLTRKSAITCSVISK